MTDLQQLIRRVAKTIQIGCKDMPGVVEVVILARSSQSPIVSVASACEDPEDLLQDALAHIDDWRDVGDVQ